MKKLSLFTTLLLLSITFSNCKKEKDPPVASFTVDRTVAEVNQMLTFTNTSENADSYLWEFGDGTTSAEMNPVHFYTSSSTFNVILTASNEAGNDTMSQSIDVYHFMDDFSMGESKWDFDYCSHSVTNGVLTMISTHSTAQSIAETDYFSETVETPWSIRGDIAIIDHTSQETDNGISVRLNDAGTFAVEFLWLSIRLNDSDVDWIWLMWVPSLATQWLPWDGSCYGTSSAIHTDGQWNTLEMSAGSDKKFTLKANGSTLTSNNEAINDFEDMAGISIGTGIDYIKIRGGNDTETNWDNIFLRGGIAGGSPFKSAQSVSPGPVTDDYVDGLLQQIRQGEDITLKSLLKQKLNK